MTQLLIIGGLALLAVLAVILFYTGKPGARQAQADFEARLRHAEWKRDSFRALSASLNRVPTYEEWHDFLDKGGAY